MQIVKGARLWLRDHPELNEAWIQGQIEADPSILGLGDVDVRDRERRQPHAGRLDLLLQDGETDRRYEVEIQLGATDESHIIRTLEYWDIERRRYPQYDHCAVIVAEEITGRFLNVISLFNGTIPLIAIKLAAFDVEGKILLTFTTVLDELKRGLVDEDEEIAEPVDRSHWEQRASKEIVALADRLLEVLRSFDPTLGLKFNKFYIGLARNGQPDNFVVFKPTRAFLKLEARIDESEELEARLTEAGLDLMPFDRRRERYRIRIRPADLSKHDALLRDMLRMAYEQSSS